jgi:hypothetical protein
MGGMKPDSGSCSRTSSDNAEPNSATVASLLAGAQPARASSLAHGGLHEFVSGLNPDSCFCIFCDHTFCGTRPIRRNVEFLLESHAPKGERCNALPQARCESCRAEPAPWGASRSTFWHVRLNQTRRWPMLEQDGADLTRRLPASAMTARLRLIRRQVRSETGAVQIRQVLPGWGEGLGDGL